MFEIGVSPDGRACAGDCQGNELDQDDNRDLNNEVVPCITRDLKIKPQNVRERECARQYQDVQRHLQGGVKEIENCVLTSHRQLLVRANLKRLLTNCK